MGESPPIPDELLGLVGDLPALPAVVADVLRVTEDLSTSTGDVSEVIQGDPAMTAKVLRVSNSSYYGMKQYVGTLKLALVILGVREVRNIVLGISVFETLNDPAGDIKVAQETWNRSLKTAGICRKMSSALGMGLQGEEFIAGLLADIGIVGLLRSNHAEAYRTLYNTLGHDFRLLRKAEQAQFGFTHAMASQAMAIQWNLPQTLSDALGYQYPVPDRHLRQARDPSLAAIVRIAKSLNLGAEGKACVTAALEEAEAWAILDTSRRPILEADRSEVMMEFIGELNSVPALPL